HPIRPRAMGKFQDLLIATARSPAMLFYLDNWESVAPGTSPPFPLSARRRGGQGVRPVPKGINENYARELLELHTLGVDGGYTQQDVIDVARIFTGWSIERPQQGGDFEFHEWAHDRGDKQVLGVRFEGGQHGRRDPAPQAPGQRPRHDAPREPQAVPAIRERRSARRLRGRRRGRVEALER